MDEEAAQFLSAVLSDQAITVDDVSRRCGLQEDAGRTLAARLRDGKIIDITPDGHVRIRPTFAAELARKLDTATQTFTEKLRRTRLLHVESLMDEASSVFQQAGYSVTALIPDRSKFSRRGIELAYSFLAEKTYRFGVLILGPSHLQQLSKMGYPTEYVWRILYQMEEGAHCLGSFILFSPELDYESRRGLTKTLADEKTRLLQQRRKFLFAQEAGLDAKELIESSLTIVENTRSLAEVLLKQLQSELRVTNELVAEASMLVTELTALATGKYLPHRRKDARLPEFMDTVKNVVDREGRNLSIFDREYGEEKQAVVREIDEFDQRQTLPDPTVLKHRLERIAWLRRRFGPIRSELRALNELIFAPYVRGVDPMLGNPFILTEPNALEDFAVNQAALKKEASRFLARLAAGGSNLRFVVGTAGSGKTHALKHIFMRLARRMRFLPVYVDCAVRYDMVSGLTAELQQNASMPDGIKRVVMEHTSQVPTTGSEFAAHLHELREAVLRRKYRGIVLMVDELENALPYVYGRGTGPIVDSNKEPALALRQLREILNSDLTRDVGFVFAMRTEAKADIRDGLALDNFERFVLTPARLSAKDFCEMIRKRYSAWHSKPVSISPSVVRMVVRTTGGNVRHTIQYFRAIYKLARERGRGTATLKMLADVGELPLFRYGEDGGASDGEA